MQGRQHQSKDSKDSPFGLRALIFVSAATNELQVRLQKIAILSTDPAVLRSRRWNASFGKPENQWNTADMSLKGATIAIAASIALTALGHALLRLQVSPSTCPYAHNLAVRILTQTTGHSYPKVVLFHRSSWSPGPTARRCGTQQSNA
jgi:hypothetical protein